MSARPRGTESVPLPDYEVAQYFPEDVELAAEQRQRIREQYGQVRAYFKLHPERFRDLQRWLNQGRYGTSYDDYLTRTVRLSAYATASGVVLGLLLSVLLVYGGLVESVQSPVTVPASSLVTFLAAHKILLGTAALTLTSGLLAGGLTAVVRYYAPLSRARLRGRSIDVVLPHAIIYMYALSYGGMNFIEVLRSLATSSDYGEVSREFDMVLRDMDLFGNDLYTALRTSRNLTPSTNLEQFLDDLLTVLDSGGDVTRFLDDESETYVEEAMEKQEDFVETLSMFSEIFIAAFVAAPLLLIVTLIVISFLGGETLVQLFALTYLVFPLGMLGYLLLIDLVSQPYSPKTAAPPLETTPLEELREVALDLASFLRTEVRSLREQHWNAGTTQSAGTTRSAATDGGYLETPDVRLDIYRRDKLLDDIKRLFNDPVVLLRRQPTLSLFLTVPLALVALAGVVVLGMATPSTQAFVTQPVRTTAWLVLLPFAVVAVPLSAFHERRRHRERAIERRFPDTLNVLSSANQMGIQLPDGLALVARWSSGTLARELSKLHNDVSWNHDTAAALEAFADRLAVPQLARVVRLIAKGGQSSGDLSRVLSVAAEDSRNRYKLERARRRSMNSYVVIVVIGFLVYLFVILMLSASYLAPLAELPAVQPTDGMTMPINVGAVPVDTYRLVFFHSAIVQGVGSGLLAGKLADNETLSGLKYSIALVALALLAFLFV
jgi:flagellar protein FlaJ